MQMVPIKGCVTGCVSLPLNTGEKKAQAAVFCNTPVQCSFTGEVRCGPINRPTLYIDVSSGRSQSLSNTACH